MSTRNCLALAIVCSLVMLTTGAQVWAQGGGIDTTDPTLPPDGVYLTPEDVHALYDGPALDIVLQAPQHRPFKDPVQRVDTPEGELETFNSELTGTAELFEDHLNPSTSLGIAPVDLFGPVQTLVLGYTSGQTGTFDTEMISMDLTGNVGGNPVIIRESPTLPSTGQVTITDLGGGNFHVDSFFDVFTEISLDGGGSWIPSAGSTHVELGVPEPASVVLLGLAVAGLAGIGYRRRK